MYSNSWVEYCDPKRCSIVFSYSSELLMGWEPTFVANGVFDVERFPLIVVRYIWPWLGVFSGLRQRLRGNCCVSDRNGTRFQKDGQLSDEWPFMGTLKNALSGMQIFYTKKSLSWTWCLPNSYTLCWQAQVLARTPSREHNCMLVLNWWGRGYRAKQDCLCSDPWPWRKRSGVKNSLTKWLNKGSVIALYATVNKWQICHKSRPTRRVSLLALIFKDNDSELVLTSISCIMCVLLLRDKMTANYLQIREDLLWARWYRRWRLLRLQSVLVVLRKTAKLGDMTQIMPTLSWGDDSWFLAGGSRYANLKAPVKWSERKCWSRDLIMMRT